MSMYAIDFPTYICFMILLIRKDVTDMHRIPYLVVGVLSVSLCYTHSPYLYVFVTFQYMYFMLCFMNMYVLLTIISLVI